MYWHEIAADIQWLSRIPEDSWKIWVERLLAFDLNVRGKFNEEIFQYKSKIDRYRIGSFDSLRTAVKQVSLWLELLTAYEQGEPLPGELGRSLMGYELELLPVYQFRKNSYLKELLNLEPEMFKQHCGQPYFASQADEFVKELLRLDLYYQTAYRAWLEKKLGEFKAFLSDHKKMPHHADNSFDILEYILTRPPHCQGGLRGYAEQHRYHIFPVVDEMNTKGMIWFCKQMIQQVGQSIMNLERGIRQSQTYYDQGGHAAELASSSLLNAEGEGGECLLIDVVLFHLKQKNSRVLFNIVTYLQMAYEISERPLLRLQVIKDWAGQSTPSFGQSYVPVVPNRMILKKIDILLEQACRLHNNAMPFESVILSASDVEEKFREFLQMCQDEQTDMESLEYSTKEKFLLPLKLGKDQYALLYLYFKPGSLKPIVYYFNPRGDEMPAVLKRMLEKDRLYTGSKIIPLKAEKMSEPDHYLWIIEAAKIILANEKVKTINFSKFDIEELEGDANKQIEEDVEFSAFKKRMQVKCMSHTISEFYQVIRSERPELEESIIPSEQTWNLFRMRHQLQHDIPTGLPIHSSHVFLATIRKHLIQYGGDLDYKLTNASFVAACARFFSSAKINGERQNELADICLWYNLTAICMPYINARTITTERLLQPVPMEEYSILHILAVCLVSLAPFVKKSAGRSSLHDGLYAIVKKHMPWALERHRDTESAAIFMMLGNYLGRFNLGTYPAEDGTIEILEIEQEFFNSDETSELRM